MISRRTLILLEISILLFAIPSSFSAGESKECRSHYQFVEKKNADYSSGTVEFDPCTMLDFGMFDWTRYSILLGIAALIATAFSYRVDRSHRLRV